MNKHLILGNSGHGYEQSSINGWLRRWLGQGMHLSGYALKSLLQAITASGGRSHSLLITQASLTA